MLATKEGLLKIEAVNCFAQNKWVYHQQIRVEKVTWADSRRAKNALLSFNLKVILEQNISKNEYEEHPGQSPKGSHHADQGWTHSNKDTKNQKRSTYN